MGVANVKIAITEMKVDSHDGRGFEEVIAIEEWKAVSSGP